MHKRQPKLFEGLRAKDLEGQVDHIFTIDQYKSKMGDDRDIVVIAFRVTDKYPAIDLMEFVEKSFGFILDADMSTGEERDGHYQVFIEVERDKKVGEEIETILGGVSQLCNCYAWKFRYHKDIESISFSKDAIEEHVPLDPQAYEERELAQKNKTVAEFFDQGSVDLVKLDGQSNLQFTKPYSESMMCKLVTMGHYQDVKEQLLGAIQLDEDSRNQTVYLEKYLGNYEIHKINNHFLIKNGNKAIIIQKTIW